VLNIFPSVDTSVCSASVRRFNAEISKFPNTILLCASLDLPFAHSRFCEAEGLKDVVPVSELRNREFGNNYGIRMVEGPLAGLLARAVVVLDEKGKVIYSKLVSELKNEPDYQSVLEVLGGNTKIKNDVCTIAATAEHHRAGEIDDPCDDGRSG